jgi:hypothetical protein
MKTITGLLLILTLIFAASCEGPMGPPGIDGIDGDNLLGTVIEIEGDFTPANDYLLYYAFPNNLEIYDGDVVLVYILWETVQTNNGGLTDVWRLLPQTVILNDGVLQYNFDYTTADVQIFLEGTSNFNNLLPAETDDQVFRIAVLPAALLKSAIIDYKDYNEVMKSLNITQEMIKKDNPTLKMD